MSTQSRPTFPPGSSTASRPCAICGAPALYIREPEGRCKAHRDVVTPATAAAEARAAAKRADVSESIARWDRATKRQRHYAPGGKGGRDFD